MPPTPDFDPCCGFNVTIQPAPDGHGWIVCDPSGGAPRGEQNLVLMRVDDRIGYQAPKRRVTDAELLVLLRQLVGAAPGKGNPEIKRDVLDLTGKAYANLRTAVPAA